MTEKFENVPKLREELRTEMTYDNRRDFYECPFEDKSIQSWIHFIYMREETLKQFDKSLVRALEKNKGKKLESINSERRFEYYFKFEGNPNYHIY